MSRVTLYHNPRCSKSRAALALLTERGVDVQIVKYLETPPDEATLAALMDRLGDDAADIIRTGEAEFRELGLRAGNLSSADTAGLLAEHPRLLQRPIAVHGDRAVIGRPPERVLEIL